MSLEADFKKACEDVAALKGNSSASEEEVLEMYGLYKQATSGDNAEEKPEEEVAALKWDAWTQRKGMSAEDAMAAYMVKANEMLEKYGEK